MHGAHPGQQLCDTFNKPHDVNFTLITITYTHTYINIVWTKHVGSFWQANFFSLFLIWHTIELGLKQETIIMERFWLDVILNRHLRIDQMKIRKQRSDFGRFGIFCINKSSLFSTNVPSITILRFINLLFNPRHW